jgi:hypothetical protein
MGFYCFVVYYLNKADCRTISSSYYIGLPKNDKFYLNPTTFYFSCANFAHKAIPSLESFLYFDKFIMNVYKKSRHLFSNIKSKWEIL